MEVSKMKRALQDLIIRLKDSEEGYMEIKHGISNVALQRWMEEYAAERQHFYKELEKISKVLGGEPEVKTSFLGKMQRLLIDFKFNHLTDAEDLKMVVDTIEAGGKKLIDDYKEVLDDIEWPKDIENKLSTQLTKIENEVNNLIGLREEIAAEPAKS